MYIRINNARLSFARNLWTPSGATPTATKKYNAHFIVGDKAKVFRDTSAPGKPRVWTATTLAEVQTLLANAASGSAAKGAAFLAGLEARQKSVREGDRQVDKNGDVRDGYAGSQYIHATTAQRPGLFNADMSPVEDQNASPFYSGCYVGVVFDLYANMNQGQRGIFATLASVIFQADGERFGGGGVRVAASDFDDIGVDNSAAGLV